MLRMKFSSGPSFLITKSLSQRWDNQSSSSYNSNSTTPTIINHYHYLQNPHLAHTITQFLFFGFFLTVKSPIAMLIAKSKTSSTPVPAFDEHSIYFACILFATDCPWLGVTGVIPCVFNNSVAFRLFRRSVFKPTNIIGVFGQKCTTSGYH